MPSAPFAEGLKLPPTWCWQFTGGLGGALKDLWRVAAVVPLHAPMGLQQFMWDDAGLGGPVAGLVGCSRT